MKQTLVLAGALLLSSCSTVSTVANGFDAHPITKQKVTQLDITQMVADAAGIEKTRKTTIISATLAFNENLDEDTKKSKRDTIIGAMLMASDQNCSIYMKDIQNYQRQTNTIAGAFETLVDAAGAVTTDALTSRIMSGASTVTSGIVSNIDGNAFASESARVLTRQISDDRKVVRRGISARMQESYSRWPLSEALGDALAYHSNCSIMSGLNGLERSATEGEQRLERVIQAAARAAQEAEDNYAEYGVGPLERSGGGDLSITEIIQDAIDKERAELVR